MPSNDADNGILIISAAVAGLVLAQGLQQRNVPFRVFERGAGIASKSQGYRFLAVNAAI
jgi:predicted NAD/FAD-dependent oxidoreductase